MTGASGRYSRVYWSIIDDPKFEEVYDNDGALATWLRLLIHAEMAYPATATIPVGTVRRSLMYLVSAGLVELSGTSRYRIVGLAAERERRSAPARTAASVRWQAPDASAMRSHSAPAEDALPGGAEQSRAKKEKEQEATHSSSDPDDHLDCYYRLTATWPSAKVLPWLNDLADKHGSRALSAALAEEFLEGEDRRTLLSRTQARLERAQHERRKLSEKAEAERFARERKQVEEMPAEQRAANMERLRLEMLKAGLIGGKSDD